MSTFIIPVQSYQAFFHAERKIFSNISNSMCSAEIKFGTSYKIYVSFSFNLLTITELSTNILDKYTQSDKI